MGGGGDTHLGESIKDILWELRKYGLALLLMHQELKQMNKVDGLLEAIYNMVGTKITFTAGEADAPWLSKIYAPNIDKDDLASLPSRYGYCKLLINGSTSDVFNFYSIDSPQVTQEVAEQSVKEIEEFNAEGRMSVEELDKMIAERYEDDDFDYDEQDFIQRAEVLNLDKSEVEKNKNQDAGDPEPEEQENRRIELNCEETEKQSEHKEIEIPEAGEIEMQVEAEEENQDEGDSELGEQEKQQGYFDFSEETQMQSEPKEVEMSEIGEIEMQVQVEENKNQDAGDPELEEQENRRIDFNFDEEVDW